MTTTCGILVGSSSAAQLGVAQGGGLGDLGTTWAGEVAPQVPLKD